MKITFTNITYKETIDLDNADYTEVLSSLRKFFDRCECNVNKLGTYNYIFVRDKNGLGVLNYSNWESLKPHDKNNTPLTQLKLNIAFLREYCNNIILTENNREYEIKYLYAIYNITNQPMTIGKWKIEPKTENLFIPSNILSMRQLEQ